MTTGHGSSNGSKQQIHMQRELAGDVVLAKCTVKVDGTIMVQGMQTLLFKQCESQGLKCVAKARKSSITAFAVAKEDIRHLREV